MPRRITVDEKEPDLTVGVKPAVASAPESATASTPAKAPTAPKDATPIDQELEEKARVGMLSAFAVHPRGIFFSGENENEEILLLLRAHIITNVPWIVAVIILALVPPVIFPLLLTLNALPNIGPGVSLVTTIFWYMGVFSYSLVKFLYWYFNVYIVTNQRAVDIDWYSIIYRKVSSTPISNIQDASAAQAGVIASLFDFGDVEIQTAGEEREFEFTSVPHPQLVAKKINELMQANQGGAGGL